MKSMGRLLAASAVAVVFSAVAVDAAAQTISNGTFNVQVGSNGEITSLQLTGDAFPTNYVMNGTNAVGQNTADHEWVGELMFTYRLNGGAFTTALTNQSSDARTITPGTNAITVTYQNSANARGVKNFKVVETYALVSDYLSWKITVTNTSTQTLELGDFGLPLSFNQYWKQPNDIIYQNRTVYHSFTGNNNSYITVGRPSGVGNFVLMVPDQSTGAGFEYMDNWVASEHAGSTWVAGGGSPVWQTGLDVFYIHSNVIKSTNRGYLPNTSLTLAPGASQTYGFKLFNVASHTDVENRLYSEGMIDVNVVPSMMLATNMTAKVDLHTTAAINSVTAQFPTQTTITSLGTVATDHKIYQLAFKQLGQNNVTVSYGTGMTTTLQFYVIEPIDAALQRHATFMIDNQQWTTGDLKGVFDDWMMDSHAKRAATGGGGWGDDWGWTHGQFLAEKNAQTPVAAEVSALDTYLDAIWARSIDNNTFIVQDWWCPAGTSAANPQNCFYDRPYAYPHAFNTYFSMYKIANLYPKLVTYHNTADTYLLRAYGIFHELYAGGAGGPQPLPPATSIISTGFMGEQTLPEMAAALTAAGHTTQAAFVTTHDQPDLRGVLRQSLSLRFRVRLRQHRGRSGVHGLQAEQRHGRDGEGQRQDAHLPRAATSLVLLRRPGHRERRELVGVPVHHGAGRLCHGRLRPHAVDDAGDRRAAVLRCEDRQHQRDQFRANRLQRRQSRDGRLDVSGDERQRLRQQLRPSRPDQHVAQRLAPDERRGRPGPVRRDPHPQRRRVQRSGLRAHRLRRQRQPEQRVLRDHADRRRVQAAEHDLAKAVVHAQP